MLPIDIGSLIDALGPVLVFAIVLIKLGLDFMSKRRERINGKDPKRGDQRTDKRRLGATLRYGRSWEEATKNPPM
jgi:hypothetical protein